MFNLKNIKKLETKQEKPLICSLAPEYGTPEYYSFYKNFGQFAYYPYTRLDCGCIYVTEKYEENSIYSHKLTYIAVCNKHLIKAQIENHRSVYQRIQQGEY